MAYNYYDHEQWPPLKPYANVSTMKVDSQPQRNNNKHVNKQLKPKEERARHNNNKRPQRTKKVVIGTNSSNRPRAKGTGFFIPRNPLTNQLNHTAVFAPVLLPAWLVQVRNMNVYGHIQRTQPKPDQQMTRPPKQDEEEKKGDDIADLLRELCLPEEWPY